MASSLLLQNPVVVVATTTNISTPSPSTVHALSSSSSCYSLSIFANNNKQPSKLSTYGKLQHYRSRHNNISCKSTANGNGDDHMFDRRNVLLGLGGLYGMAGNLGLANNNQSAIALPVPIPDIKNCGEARTFPNIGVEPKIVDYNCCPKIGEPMPYKIPVWLKKRERPAAHQVMSEDYKAKYSRAIQTMKNLKEDDPHNFWNQAKIHCSYCNGAFKQLKDNKSDPSIDYQVHSNWLFLPFHRWYLYFFERIVAKYTRGLDGQNDVIDDDFALPFWNWDNPNGMRIPPMYLSDDYDLGDSNRNIDHLDKLVNLRTGTSNDDKSDRHRIEENLCIVHRFMFQDHPPKFFGAKFRGGEKPPNEAGTIEEAHSFVHVWMGDPRRDHKEDMGNFYSAARDPIFYGHHANIDRLWNVWKTLDTTYTDPSDNDWKNSAFLFYDENRKLVSVKVNDCLKTEDLGYVYESVDNTPWIEAEPTPKALHSTPAARSKSTELGNVVFPVTLDKVVKVLLERDSKSRRQEAKDTEVEELVLEGIEYDMEKFVDFDVYINDKDDNDHAKPCHTEYLGCFSRLVHVDPDSPHMKGTARMRIPLTKVLEKLRADDDDTVVIKLVPRDGGQDVKVRAIKIGYSTRV